MAKTVPEMKGYVLTERLGCGTFATVYKAYKKSKAKEIAAIKCIEKKRLNKRSMENLLTEISVMKDLDHKHIVKLIDFEWDERFIYLIMEYCDGGDLSHFITNKVVLRESSARKFLRQLALALQFLRDKGIAHMDLKPQNLLLTGIKPVLKVGDFGMAQHLGVDDVGESFRGSPLYMAPEVMLGEPYDAKVDLWSVGIILYETLFGEAPFASRSLSELTSKIRNSDPVVIPSTTQLSDECRDLLQKLLQRDPDKRISFDDFFKHPFIDLEHTPTSECLPKARELVTKAVASDSEGRLSTAIILYTQALEYFIPALEFEEDLATRDALRQKIEQYIQRTESLKETLQCKKASHPSTTQLSMHQIEKYQADFPEIKTAMMKADNAERQYNCGNYAAALDSFKQAVAILMSLVGGA